MKESTLSVLSWFLYVCGLVQLAFALSLALGGCGGASTAQNACHVRDVLCETCKQACAITESHCENR